jgi:hypothetical protein
MQLEDRGQYGIFVYCLDLLNLKDGDQIGIVGNGLSVLKNFRFDATKKISKFVPPLISGKLVNAQIELECSSLLQNGGFSKVFQIIFLCSLKFEKDFHEHQKTLEKYLPEKTHTIKQLNHPQILHVLSAYHLETLRSTTGVFHLCLTYAENIPKNFPMGAQLLDCFEGIADKVNVTNYNY